MTEKTIRSICLKQCPWHKQIGRDFYIVPHVEHKISDFLFNDETHICVKCNDSIGWIIGKGRKWRFGEVKINPKFTMPPECPYVLEHLYDTES